MSGLKMSMRSSLSRLPNGKASQLQLLQIHSKFLFVRFLISYAFRALHSIFLWKYFWTMDSAFQIGANVRDELATFTTVIPRHMGQLGEAEYK